MPCCFFCERNDIPLHVHHKSYKALGKEPLMHLELLCELCHVFAHKTCDDFNLDLWKGTKKAGSIIRKAIKTAEGRFKKKHKNKIIQEVIIMPTHTNINFGNSIQLRKKMVNS